MLNIFGSRATSVLRQFENKLDSHEQLDCLMVCLRLQEFSSCFVFSDNDIVDVIENVFCVDHEAFGERKQHELKPGGKDIPVTEENKKEYVK